MKMTRQTYVEYIIGTPINYTCTHLADHLTDGISHDVVNDYLRREIAFGTHRLGIGKTANQQ